MDFNKIITLESEGSLDQAICELDRSAESEVNANVSRFYQEALNRMIERSNGSSLMENLETELLFPEVTLNDLFDGDIQRPIVSLTAISSRLDGVFSTVGSLLNQELQAYSINLFISEENYLVDAGFDKSDPRLKELYELGVNIYFTQNIGPYRKQYPIIKLLRELGFDESSIFITVDDDVIYPPSTLRILTENLLATESVSAYRGRAISCGKDRLAAYKSFGKPNTYTSLENLGTGKNGIAYRLGFFPTDYNLFMGPIIAPTADDLWCKWVTGMYCIPTTIIEPNSAFDPSKDFDEVSPDDKVGLFHVFNAKGRNDTAIHALEIYFRNYRASMFEILKRNL